MPTAPRGTQLGPRAVVQLRPWSTSDASALYEAVIDSEDLHTQFGRGDLSTLDGCVDVIKRQLAVTLPSVQNFVVAVDGRAMGNVGVSHMEHRHDTGWMHYWLAAEVRGHGLATQAVATVATWAFTEGDLFRLELGHRVANPASCHVASRAGFRAEGIERLKLKLGRQRFDIETHARLRTDASPHIDLLPVRWASGP
jgi:[ribosomal protein S5]-alanine N-acetyltransferase